MIYTELGNGDKKRTHEVEGTTRAAFEVGDMPRDDMAVYAEEVHKRHPLSLYEAFEVRVSFSPDELKAGDVDDERMAGEHGYKLCKRFYSNSMCYVTVHNDGKGGCVHAHCLVVNHDEVMGQTLRDNRRHFEVKDASDELAVEERQCQAREETEKRLYEFRKNMWDAEKKLKAANRAIDHEMSQRGDRRVTSYMQDICDAAYAKVDTMDDIEFE